jgi:hypothetical protein
LDINKKEGAPPFALFEGVGTTEAYALEVFSS